MTQQFKNEMAAIMREHLIGDGERDVRTFNTNLSPGGTKFVEQGGRASEAAHKMSDLRSGAIAQAIDAKLSAGELAVKFCRLNEAYKLLAAAGVDID